MDETWNRLQSWVFPSELIKASDGYSCSGGAFGPDGRLYVTGHDHPKLYLLNFQWEDQTFNGCILKAKREVIIGKVVIP